MLLQVNLYLFHQCFIISHLKGIGAWQQENCSKHAQVCSQLIMQFRTTLLIFSPGVESQKSTIKAVETNISIPDIIIEIVPGASLRHREWHVPGHSTSSIRRNQAHHFGFTEGKSYQNGKLEREKNVMLDRAIKTWNWMKLSNWPIAILSLHE